MVNYNGAKIKRVSPGSIGAQLELEPGDVILSINRHNLLDFIDYLVLSSEGKLNLEVAKKNGELLEIEFEKDPEEPLGLSFEDTVFDKVRVCNNHCLFCFVHQLPAGQRASLYVRDDDYRLSFLQGCYITLTNLKESDWRRIEEQHLTPLYISVHATDPAIREKLLGNKNAGRIIDQLQRLVRAGITVHTQAVICPGINDGPVLERTIADLAQLWPSVASLAVVPVGLTNWRQNLYQLRGFLDQEAAAVLKIITAAQKGFLQQLDTRFVFAADEWYILSGAEFPPDEEYEGYPQLDNGVGLIRWFLSEFSDNLADNLKKLRRLRVNFVIITATATARLWEQVKKTLFESCPEINIDILPVTNDFFGPLVTVSGLLVGRDIQKAIAGHRSDRDSCYLIPEITLRQGELFLDGMSVPELKRLCAPKKIEIVPTRARDWLEWIVDKGCVAGWQVR